MKKRHVVQYTIGAEVFRVCLGGPGGGHVSRELWAALEELGVCLSGGKSSRSPFPSLRGKEDAMDETTPLLIRSMKQTNGEDRSDVREKPSGRSNLWGAQCPHTSQCSPTPSQPGEQKELFPSFFCASSTPPPDISLQE